MSANRKPGAFLNGSAFRYIAIACLICLGALTASVVLSAVFRGAAAVNSSSLSAGEIPIGGQWQLMRGDEAVYAQAGFDDSGWETVSIPSNIADPSDGQNAVQWLRKRIYMPSDEQGYYNAVRLGTIHAADEVYFNGVLIGSTGSMTREWDINYDKARIYPLPMGSIRQGDWNVVAVRVRSFLQDVAGIYKGSPAIGNQVDFTRGSIMREVPLMVILFVLFFSGIIFIFLSIVKSGQGHEYLHLSAFVLLMAIHIFLTTQLRFNLPIDFVLDKKIKFTVLSLLLPVFLRFIYKILLSQEKEGLAGKISRGMDILSRWIFIYPLVYITANWIIGDMRLFMALDSAVNDKVILVFSALTIVIIVYMVAKGRRDALFLLAGLTVFAVTVVHDIAVPEQSVNFTLNYSSFGVLALVLSMNLIIAYRMQNLTVSLGKANVEIASHNRQLDQQVREKTKSLVEANDKLEENNRELSRLNEQLKAAQAKLEKIASTDSLTGLYNRFEIDKRLQYEAHTMKRYGKCTFEGFSILYIDMDNFKYINDTFGHQAGDLVLVSFAEILKSATRAVDIVARYGGDEFIVLMPNTDYEGAKAIADRIAKKLEEADSFKQYLEELKKHPVSIDERYRLSGSYGIAVYKEGESIDEMIKRADKALYAMKALKR